MTSYQDVLDFWFQELSPQQWFIQDGEIDQTIQNRFLTTNQQAKAGELVDWRNDLAGRVAEIIVLDQFSRNLYREDGRAYSSDDMALVLAQEIQKQSGFNELPKEWQLFSIMPYMHAESRVIQEQSVQLFSQYDEWKDYLKHAQAHKAIIDEFGRYPSRNKQIGRTTTSNEAEWLANNDYLS
ncbi:DUF924 domain-containing protein [Aerococcaceae bacterium DSM 111020]|nr:DUF924 domain-containing protein [Aerococcaceae bacterium DSM 111020]